MPPRSGDYEDPRRAFLRRALAAGLLGIGGAPPARAQLFGRRPAPMPAGRSVYETLGAVTVDGQAVEPGTRIGATARVEAGAGAQLIFVVGTDAFILRQNSQLQLDGDGFVVAGLRLVTGALLSVFGRGRGKRLSTLTATIGIRGTGLYVEAEPERSYVCNCYGEIEIAAADAPQVNERIVSKHHDAPRYVLSSGAVRRIQPAPAINHTDVELALIEALVGRVPPFSLFDEDYGGARRY